MYTNVDGYTITRCMSCRLVFVREQITVPELIEYYSQADGEDFVYADPENVSIFNHYFLKLRELLEKSMPRGAYPGYWLFCGVFSGSNGWLGALWHRDSIHLGRDRSQKEYGENIHVGTLEDANYPAEFFDVITLQDTFDHLTEIHLKPFRIMSSYSQVRRAGSLSRYTILNVYGRI